jgi:predicted ATPase/DNA-binding winged helix-turn-helix (wHTH) protein
VTDQTTTSAERAVSFGPFRLLPAQQLLLEGETPVRLGSRALEILIALVERAGELVSKSELMARVWPNTFVDEGSIKVHVAGLRRALGDGQPGRRYVANVPGRGYRFVAPVELFQPERPPAPKSVPRKVTHPHNLPISRARALGRTDTIDVLRDQVPRRRFLTILGAGGIGKTTVALAIAEELLPAYEHGVWLVDLAPLGDPRLVPSTLASALGLAIHSDNAVSGLVDLLRDKRMLIVFDNCEHVIETAATLTEELLDGVPGMHILATSREPLRAKGERIHRLAPLESPSKAPELTAAEALAFPAVQLFVERAVAVQDDFQLSDLDAPIVADICRKLGGVALAIELAAARIDAFGIGQLSALLDDRIEILNKGKRTAQPRHQSLAAALDWSYEFLPETERVVLRRLSVFAGFFLLESAIAVAGDADTDVVENLANLVAKSLVSADVGGAVVQYRLLDTTRTYAMRKLTESGDLDQYVRRHAYYHRTLLEQADAEYATRPTNKWQEDYGLRIDDVRSALNWVFSPNGDASFGLALTAASIPLWMQLSLTWEARESIERALANQTAEPTQDGPAEMKLLSALGGVLMQTMGPVPNTEVLFSKALRIAESLDDDLGQVKALLGLSTYHLSSGNYRGAVSFAEKTNTVAAKFNDIAFSLIGNGVAGQALHHMGDYAAARNHIYSMLNQYSGPVRYPLAGFRVAAQSALSSILWIRGFPDQAIRSAENALGEAEATGTAQFRINALAHAACPIALCVGNLDAANDFVTTILELSAKQALAIYDAQGRCLEGTLLLAREDFAGLTRLSSALDRLREAKFNLHNMAFSGVLAQGLGAAGQIAEAHIEIDEALERSDRNEERWCLPELLRTKGELLRLEGSAIADQTAEDYFQQALDCARGQGALSWELRATMSLARLWRQNGKTAEAHGLLSAVYNRFTEGFETSDLRAARALIDEIHKGAS